MRSVATLKIPIQTSHFHAHTILIDDASLLQHVEIDGRVNSTVRDVTGADVGFPEIFELFVFFKAFTRSPSHLYVATIQFEISRFC